MVSANQLKYYRSLFQKKVRQKEGKFLIEGVNLCEAAVNHGADLELMLASHDAADKHDIAAVIQAAQAQSCPIEWVPNSTINKLSEAMTPQGLVAVVRFTDPRADLADGDPPEVLLLDQIRDPGNLGSILRTADWFGIRAVGLMKSCVELFNPKVLRSSAGACFSLPVLHHGLDFLDSLKRLVQKGYTIYAASPEGQTPFNETDFRRPFALIMGSERHGVDNRIEAIPSQQIVIPGSGRADSLNVAVSAGILLAEAFRDQQGRP